MVLEGETPAGGAGAPPVKNRITWSPEPEGRVRQHWETSPDGGKTWATAFDGMYHPVKSRRHRRGDIPAWTRRRLDWLRLHPEA